MGSETRYIEVPHTADLALQVFGADHFELLRNAVDGLLELSGVVAMDHLKPDFELTLPYDEIADLLISLLNEVLYYLEKKVSLRLVSSRLNTHRWIGKFLAGEVVSRERMIKAATYHNLDVVATPTGFITTIVFDV